MDDIEIVEGLPEAFHEEAVKLACEAYFYKFNSAACLQEPTLSLVSSSIHGRTLIGGFRGSHLVGLVVLRKGGRGRARTGFSGFAGKFGAARGTAWYLQSLLLGLAAPVARGDLVVEAMAVDPLFRGLGIGSKLLRFVFNWGASRGARTVSLEVVDSNIGAVRFYTALGFRPISGRLHARLLKSLRLPAITTMIRQINDPVTAGKT